MGSIYLSKRQLFVIAILVIAFMLGAFNKELTLFFLSERFAVACAYSVAALSFLYAVYVKRRSDRIQEINKDRFFDTTCEIGEIKMMVSNIEKQNKKIKKIVKQEERPCLKVKDVSIYDRIKSFDKTLTSTEIANEIFYIIKNKKVDGIYVSKEGLNFSIKHNGVQFLVGYSKDSVFKIGVVLMESGSSIQFKELSPIVLSELITLIEKY